LGPAELVSTMPNLPFGARLFYRSGRVLGRSEFLLIRVTLTQRLRRETFREPVRAMVKSRRRVRQKTEGRGRVTREPLSMRGRE
jgi:hypothetical protein